MPDPLPPWAKKIWMDFLRHVQEEQDVLKLSRDLAAKVEVGGDASAQEVKETWELLNVSGVESVEEGWP